MGAALAIDPESEQPTEVPERRLPPAEEARLVQENEKLVHFWARRLKTTSYEDAVQAGMIGLLTAIRKFEPERGFKLSTYASNWIRSFIQASEIELDPKGGKRSMNSRQFQIRKAIRELVAEGVAAPTVQQVSHRTGIQPDRVAALLEWNRAIAQPIDAPMGDDESQTLADILPNSGPLPEELAADSEALTKLRAELNSFAVLATPRERALLKHRVLSTDPKTLEEIGAKFDVTKERMHQIEVKVIDKLERFMRRKHGTEFDVRAALANPVTRLPPLEVFDAPVRTAEKRAPEPVRSVQIGAVTPSKEPPPTHKTPTCARCGAPLSVRSLKEGYDRCGICRQSGPEKHAGRAIPDNPVTGSGRVRAPGTGNVWHKKGRWYAKEPESIKDGRRYARYIGSFATPEEAHAACDKWVEDNGGPKRELVMPTCSIPGCTTMLQGRSLEKGDGLCGVHRQAKARGAKSPESAGGSAAESEVVAAVETPAEVVQARIVAPVLGREKTRMLTVRPVDVRHNDTGEPNDPVVDARAFVARRDELKAKLESELEAVRKREREIEELLGELQGTTDAIKGTPLSYGEQRREMVKGIVVDALRGCHGGLSGKDVVRAVQSRNGTLHHTAVYAALYALCHEKKIQSDDGQYRYWLPGRRGASK